MTGSIDAAIKYICVAEAVASPVKVRVPRDQEGS
jgi:hypothetical protein